MLVPALTQCADCCLNLAHPPQCPFSRRKWCWKTDHCHLILSVCVNERSWIGVWVTNHCHPALQPAHCLQGVRALGSSSWSISSDALGPAYLGMVLLPGGRCVAGGILGTVSCQFPGACCCSGPGARAPRVVRCAVHWGKGVLTWLVKVVSEWLRCSAKCSKRLAWCFG